ncbi:chemotaxis response regulator protein-glutamate methylesterase [Peptostreptococcaceae bacterium AGR-M142]
MKKIKVLIVDDSAFIRKIVEDILKKEDSIEVVAKVKNGKEALDYIYKNEVDVVTLDVEMPVKNGIETLEELMQTKPTPVVMISSLTKEGADLTIKALDLGAVDFITKPSNIFKISQDEVGKDIINKVKIASRVRISKNERIKPHKKIESSIKKSLKENRISRDSSGGFDTIVSIGTSTGGPRALQEVIPNLKFDIKAPVLVVQHMPPGFTKSLAERLDSLSQINVKEAEEGDVLQKGFAYIAPGDRHLTLRKEGAKLKIHLDNGANVTGHKPSVDKMFYSLSELNKYRRISVIMTGMGSDGAKGMELLKEQDNVYTIAEDESTCIVFGMPKSAINLNVVDKVLPVQKIANEINKLMEV